MKRRRFKAEKAIGSDKAAAARVEGALPGQHGDARQDGGNIVRLAEGLYWIRDTCNVYLLVQSDRAIMIDCGTDTQDLDLASFGVARLDKVLLTHFHRDQCSSADSWHRRGAGIVVPYAERGYLEESDLMRASHDICDDYTSYYPYFGPLSDLQAEGYAYDYDTFAWQGIQFSVVPLPGHTYGSVGYLFELEGKRILACGDLMSRPGKLATYYWSQWRYMDFQGHVNHLESLDMVAELKPDLVLPGHGAPFPFQDSAIDDLRRPLERIYELFHARPRERYRPVFRHLTQHVIEVTNSSACSYIVRDDAGHALMIDSGFTSAAPIAGNPHRYIDHLSPSLGIELGIREVEWFLPTHYHDDHLAGYPALRSRYGTKLLCSAELQDILEHPERYNMPCLLPQGLPVDRIIGRGQPFSWRGIDFYIEQHPGQTLYHHLIWFHADGKKFLAIGDNISGLSFRECRDYIYSFIPKNRTPVSSYGAMPRQILERAPDMLLTGHGGAVSFDRQRIESWQRWMEEWEDLWRRVIDQETPDVGMDPQWIEFCPFKIRVHPGQSVRFLLRITNYCRERRTCVLRFRSVENVSLDPIGARIEVPGRGVASQTVTARFPSDLRRHSIPIVADVTWDGIRLGEVAEAVAYW